MKRKRVAVVRHGEYPLQPHLRRDVVALRDAGFDVDVICDSSPGLPHFERSEGVTVIRVPLRHERGGLGRYLFEYAAMPVLAAGALTLRSIGRRYDFVEIDTMPTWLLAAAIVPKLLGATVVLYMFEHMGELYASDKGVPESEPVARLLDAIDMACVRAADHVLTPAERHRERFIRRGIRPEKVTFIPNCPDENLFLSEVRAARIAALPRSSTKLTEESFSALAAPSPAGERTSSNHFTLSPATLTTSHANRKDGDEFLIVTHGSLLERYGIQDLIQAVASLRQRIPGLKLKIIGEGEYDSELKRLTRELSVVDIVSFTGLVFFDHMASHLLEADLAVAPYLLDLLPNKVMEYLLLGIPAVVADWPTMRRYFADDTITYVEPDNVPALAKAIEALCLDPERRARQAAAARERYLATLAWSKTKADYLAAYGIARHTINADAVESPREPAAEKGAA